MTGIWIWKVLLISLQTEAEGWLASEPGNLPAGPHKSDQHFHLTLHSCQILVAFRQARSHGNNSVFIRPTYNRAWSRCDVWKQPSILSLLNPGTIMQHLLHLLSLFLVYLLTFANSQSTFTSTPFGLNAIPLAVRHPYLNSYLLNGTTSTLSNSWPQFWDGLVSNKWLSSCTGRLFDLYKKYLTGWAGYVRVDGQAYRFLGQSPGAPGQAANQTSVSWTPTQSTFQFSAGPVAIIAEFLSPIEVSIYVSDRLT